MKDLKRIIRRETGKGSVLTDRTGRRVQVIDVPCKPRIITTSDTPGPVPQSLDDALNLSIKEKPLPRNVNSYEVGDKQQVLGGLSSLSGFVDKYAITFYETKPYQG